MVGVDSRAAGGPRARLVAVVAQAAWMSWSSKLRLAAAASVAGGVVLIVWSDDQTFARIMLVAGILYAVAALRIE